MLLRIILAGLLFTFSSNSLSHAQGTPTTSVGWYNGDCHSTGTGGWSNWYLSSQQFTRVYDEFLVSTGGWTVVGVFSNNLLTNAPPVTQASWEIRSGVSSGNGGTLIASGVNPATETYSASVGAYRIEVDGLEVKLAAGTYYVSVTPVGVGYQQSYVCETTGPNAIGAPAGNGLAYYSVQSSSFTWLSGTGGTNLNFSQGVLISGTPQPPPSTSDQWQADVTNLVQQMTARYGPAFPGISMTDWQTKAADLNTRIPSISDAEIRTGIQALVASIGDPHTDVEWGSPSPFRRLPLTFSWFDDGLYVIGAPSQYRNLLGGKVTWVGQTSVDDAWARLTPLVPHANDWWVRYDLPRNIITSADFLYGTGVTSATDSVYLEAQTASGSVSATVQTLNPGQLVSQSIGVFQGTLPLYRQHFDTNLKYYWATVIDEGRTVYFQYNQCEEDPQQPFASFQPSLDQMLAQTGIERLIVNMRNNTGGFTTDLSPWITALESGPFNRRGRLYVIIGRATFSAAMALSNMFHEQTAAIFVGQPTGGTPRFMIRQGDFQLPYFGVGASYSNGIWPAKDYSPSLMPDIPAGLTFQQYMNGEDPALDAILNGTQPRLPRQRP